MSNNIYAVAKRAGVSSATVSRVMNNRGGVSSKTAIRIQQVMDQMGYRPKWKANACQSVGLLVVPGDEWLCQPYSSAVVSAISEILMAEGVALTMIPFSKVDDSIVSLGAFLTTHQIQGVLVMASSQIYGVSQQLQTAGYPHVSIGPEHLPQMVHRVGGNDFQAGQNAANYLWQMGHRTFAVVSPSLGDEGHSQRVNGFLHAITGLGGDVAGVIRRVCMDVTLTAGESMAHQLLLQPNRPDAVLITNSQLAIGFSRGCRQLGVRIPDDVSLLGFEDGEELLGIDPPMTAMRQPAREIGKHAARLLLKQISEQGNKDAAENDAEKNLFEIPLVVRGSVKNNLD